MQVDLNENEKKWRYNFLKNLYKKLYYIKIEFNNKKLQNIVLCLFQLGIFIITKNYFTYFLIGGLFFVLANTKIIKNIDTLIWDYMNKKNEVKEKSFQLNYKNIIRYISEICEYGIDYTDTFIISILLSSYISNIYSIYDTLISSIASIISSIYEIIFEKCNYLFEKIRFEKTKRVYIMLLLAGIIYFLLGYALYFYLNRFIKDWQGYKLVLARHVVLLIVLNICMLGITYTVEKNIKLLENNYESKQKSVIIFIFVISASIILGKKFGIIGILSAGLIGRGLINLAIEIGNLLKLLEKNKEYKLSLNNLYSLFFI